MKSRTNKVKTSVVGSSVGAGLETVSKQFPESPHGLVDGSSLVCWVVFSSVLGSVLSGSGDDVGSDCPSDVVTGSVGASLLAGVDFSEAGSEVVGSVVPD